MLLLSFHQHYLRIVQKRKHRDDRTVSLRAGTHFRGSVSQTVCLHDEDLFYHQTVSETNTQVCLCPTRIVHSLLYGINHIDRIKGKIFCKNFYEPHLVCIPFTDNLGSIHTFRNHIHSQIHEGHT